MEKMETHNKLYLAGDLLVEAASIYKLGNSNIEFAKSILLAGAVIGIVSPYLEEQKIKSSHVELSELSAQLRKIDLSQLNECERRKEMGRSINFYRMTYNSLKHTGKKDKVKPSQDLILEANLKEEASYLIEHAISDFKKIPFTQSQINNILPDKLLTLLQSF